MIHESVIVYGQASVAADAFVGPYCVLGAPSNPSAFTPGRAGGAVEIGPFAQLLSHVVVGEGSRLGARVWCDHHTYIGCHSSISDDVEIMYGARIYDRVTVATGAWIGGFLCNDAVVEAHAIVLGLIVHKFVNAVEGVPEEAPRIRAGAFVGMGAVVVGGIEVETGAYIAAGSVLTGDARAKRLYAGVPARDVGAAPHPFASPGRGPQ